MLSQNRSQKNDSEYAFDLGLLSFAHPKKERRDMQKITQQQLDTAYLAGSIRKIRVIRVSEKQWYFTADVFDFANNKTQTFALLTQRGRLRIWSDPRNLFSFLRERYKITYGLFILDGDLNDAEIQSLGFDDGST